VKRGPAHSRRRATAPARHCTTDQAASHLDRRVNVFSISDVEDLGCAKVVEMALDRAWDGCDGARLHIESHVYVCAYIYVYVYLFKCICVCVYI